MEGERGTMRRLSIPVVLAVLMAISIPAWAKPAASHVVTWTVGSGTVTLDTATGLVELDVTDQMMVECEGAFLFATIEMSGSATANDFSIDRQGRSGSFSATSDQLTISIDGCEYLTTNSISGSFETNKGKADDRRRVGSDRIIERSGTGSLTAEAVVFMETADVAAVTTISR